MKPMHAKRLETKSFHSEPNANLQNATSASLLLWYCISSPFLLLLCEYRELCRTSAFVANTVKLEKALGLSKQIKDEEAK